MPVYWVIPFLAWCLGAIMGAMAMAMMCAAGDADERAQRQYESWKDDTGD